MRNLLIIGAGGFGREVLMYALDSGQCGVDWRIKGFLDDRPGILDGYTRDAGQLADAAPYSDELRAHYKRDYRILGDPMTHMPADNEVFVCAVGDPAARRKYATPILERGGEFISLLHPRASVSAFASIGAGSIVGPFAAISPDARIGRFVTINSYTGIAHDVRIGDWCEIDGQCLIAGRAIVGESVRIHAGAIVTPDVQVGARAVIGAGSVVFGRVPEGATVIGNPARRFDWQKSL